MKTKTFIIALMTWPLFFACSDDNDILEGGNGDMDDIVEEEVPAKMYINWDATFQTVQDSTKGYELVSSESDFLHYYSEKLNQTLSYEFTDNLLTAVAIVFPETDSVQTLTDSMLSGYKYIGEKDSVAVYLNDLQKTFAVKYLTEELSDSISGTFVVVGFTPQTK